MRAAVFEDIQTISYRDDYPLPSLGDEEVLVKVHYCAICGTDVKNWLEKIYQAPLVMGHEFAGVIEQLGSGMGESGFEVGDRVTGINVQLDTSAELRGMGIFRDGGFAEYVAVPRDFLFHVPDSVSLRDASMIESFAVAVRALNWANIQEPQNIVVIGAGNIGLTTLSVLKARGHPNAEKYLLVVEPHDYQSQKARELGATEVLPPSKAKLRRFFKKNGDPDFIFECAGNESAILLAIDIIKHGGQIIMESVQKGKIAMPIFMLSSKEIGFRGSLSHNHDDIEATLQLFASGRVDPAAIISEVVELPDIQGAFERYLDPERRNFVKLVVKI